MTHTSNEENGATLFEAANKLRGSVESAEYKHLVLGLIFLKYISDSLENRRQELEAELSDPSGESFVEDPAERAEILEDRDEYISENVFWEASSGERDRTGEVLFIDAVLRRRSPKAARREFPSVFGFSTAIGPLVLPADELTVEYGDVPKGACSPSSWDWSVVSAKRCPQILADADVVDDQPARLISEDPVYTRSDPPRIGDDPGGPPPHWL